MNEKRIVNIISNRNFKSRKTAEALIDKFESRDVHATEKYNQNAELNICIGGDGAFLRAIHRNGFPPIPFIGVNTGHLGFFQEISPSEIDQFILDYMDNKFLVEELLLVDAQVCTKSKCFNLTGVNEIVIKGVRSKLIHLDVFIDDNHLEKFSGDGLIVSTPSGSSAYNFSAGGSIVHPTLSSLQITPLAPISSSAYRSLPNSAIVPGDSKIKIVPETRYENSILVVNDGMEFKYSNIEQVILSSSPKYIKKLTFSKDTYWKNLKSKFL